MDGKYVVARKAHDCDLCPWAIPAGMEYWREDATPWDHPDNDGYFTIKAHRLCIDFHAANRRENEGLIHEWQWDDELWDEVHNCPIGKPYSTARNGDTIECDCGFTVSLTSAFTEAHT